MSGLAGWCSLNFSILVNIWSQTLFGMNGVSGLGSNGAANAFSSVCGWLPGVALFFVSLCVTLAVFRWLPKNLKKANKPRDATGSSTVR